jgi:hypothetical protein
MMSSNTKNILPKNLTVSFATVATVWIRPCIVLRALICLYHAISLWFYMLQTRDTYFVDAQMLNNRM